MPRDGDHMTNERPKQEPEIIPPGRAERGRPRRRVFANSTEHIYVGKPPPFGIILVVLITGLLSAAMLILLLGAFLIALPVIVVFITAAIVAGLLRMYFSPSD
jgi:hypothetical protein